MESVETSVPGLIPSPDKPMSTDPPPATSPSPAGFKLPTLPTVIKGRKSDVAPETPRESEVVSTTEPTEPEDSSLEPVKHEDGPPVPATNIEALIESNEETSIIKPTPVEPVSSKPTKSPAEISKANSIPLPYQEPSWGGIPENKYFLEVLKTGTIVDTIQLQGKSFFTVGRLENCDIILEHPSLSRYIIYTKLKILGIWR